MLALDEAWWRSVHEDEDNQDTVFVLLEEHTDSARHVGRCLLLEAPRFLSAQGSLVRVVAYTLC